MSRYSLSHLADQTLLRELGTLVSDDRNTTALLIAHLAEVDARRLYRPAAYSSMYEYCVRELRLSDSAAYKRIEVARLARRFPVLFSAIADGRLNLSSIMLLAPRLTSSTIDELVAAATHKTSAEVRQILATRFPQPDLPTWLRPIGSAGTIAPSSDDANALQLAPGLVEMNSPEVTSVSCQLASKRVEVNSPEVMPLSCQLAPGRVEMNSAGVAPAWVGGTGDGASQRATTPVAGVGDRADELAITPVERPLPGPSHARLAPLSAERFALQVTLGKETHDKLRYVQSLLGHAVPSGDIAQVLDRALDELARKLEKRRFAAPTRTRPRSHASASATESRYVPANVRSAVWQRDGGQCTFVSERGRRCEANSCLEFDHVHPVGRGGTASIAGMRLRCRAHNQLEAERVYGEAFMRGKREQARERTEKARAEARAMRESETRAEAEAGTESDRDVRAKSRSNDVIPWLRQLGFRADEARRAAEKCDAIPEASLEERVRFALRHLEPSCRHVSAHLAGGSA